MVVLIFAVSFIFMGTSCKEPEVIIETVVETVVETVEVEKEAEPAGEEKVTLTFANWSTVEEVGRDDILAVLDDFEEKNPNVVIENMPIPFENLKNQLITMAAAGNAPDVMQLYGNWVFELGSMGALADLYTIADQEYIDDYFPNYLELTTFEGKLIAAPKALIIHAFWYNKDLMAKAGVDSVPKTIDELMDASEKIKQALGPEGINPIGLDTTASEYSLTLFWGFIWNHGADPLRDGVNFNTPEMVEAFEFLREVVRKEYTPEGVSVRDIRELFADEKVVFMIDIPFIPKITASLNEEMSGDVFREKVGVTTLPISDNVTTAYTEAEVTSIAMSEQAENKEIAMKFVEHLTRSDIVTSNWLLNLGFTPPVKSQSDSEKWPILDEDPYMQAFSNEISPTVVAPALGPNYGTAAQFIVNGMQRAIHTDEPIEDIVAEVEANLKIVYGE